MAIGFWKYHGSGNDFIILNDEDLKKPSIVRSLCSRKTGIGADGILFCLPSSQANCSMEIFNADGSEASFCGNGLTCMALHLAKPKSLIETPRGIFSCKLGKLIDVELPTATFQDEVELFGYKIFIIDTGVPHGVIFVEDIHSVDVKTLGKTIRFHPMFKPYGINVNFVEKKEDFLLVRTYERGVEAETNSCGTGGAAAAVALKKTDPVQTLFKVKSLSGSEFIYTIPSLDTHIVMSSNPSFVFSGLLP